MRYPKLLALVLLSGLLAMPAAAQQRDDALARLERARTANPGSVAALRALGIAYYKRNRFADARTVLDASRRLDPRDGLSALYAGLSAEALKDYTSAKDAYNTYLQVGRTRRVRNDIAKRLVVVARLELHAAAQRAIADEARLSQQAADARAVAVMPMSFSGTDQSLAPLGRGLTDLLVGDLSRSPAVQLLERDRVQAIVDELKLGATNQVDASSAARTGRIARAGRIVQGAITQTGARTLAVNAAVLNTASSQQQGKDVQATDAIDQIFNIEKTLALGVFDQLGVRLSAAERQAFDTRPTRSLQAFLAYSNGLVAQDEGRWDDAARFFDQARTIDPGFAQAFIKAQAARAAQQGTEVTGATVESGLKGTAEGAAVSGAERGVAANGNGVGATLANAVGDVNPSAANGVNQSTGGGGNANHSNPPTTRDATSEKTGTDQPAQKTGQVTIIIRKP